MDCNTCKFGNNKTVATCVDCGDDLVNWQLNTSLIEQTCTTCKFDGTGDSACYLCDENLSSWCSRPTVTLARTAEQWSKIDATMVAAECSPSMIRELIEDAQRDIVALHKPVHSPERFNGQP